MNIEDIKNKIIHGDCIEVMENMSDKSVNLIIADPPYNINKADWDKIPNYIEWLGSKLLETQRVLKDNGSLYLFHNNFLQMVEIQNWINKNTRFVFKQLIVWNKKFKDCKGEEYLQGFNETNQLRNYQKMAEYILFYTFQDDTGLTKVKLDLNNFTSLREYFRDFQWALGLSKKQIVEKIGQSADHCFRWNSSQWDLPTKETYLKICEIPLRQQNFKSREYEFIRREYEDLRLEYEDLRYTFNNQKSHHSVWNYDIAERVDHITPKPISLIKNILTHSSNEGDIVLIPFVGSGNDCIACKELKRNYIGIEKEFKYVEMAKKRVDAIPKTLF